MSKFDEVLSGPDKNMDAQVTKWLQDNEDKLSDETKEYTTYDPNKGDHQEFDTENSRENESRSDKSREIGVQAVKMMDLPEPTPEPTPAPEMPPEMQ